MKLKFRGKSAIVAIYAEASEYFREWRGNMGSRQCPNGELYDITASGPGRKITENQARELLKC